MFRKSISFFVRKVLVVRVLSTPTCWESKLIPGTAPLPPIFLRSLLRSKLPPMTSSSLSNGCSGPLWLKYPPLLPAFSGEFSNCFSRSLISDLAILTLYLPGWALIEFHDRSNSLIKSIDFEMSKKR